MLNTIPATNGNPATATTNTPNNIKITSSYPILDDGIITAQNHSKITASQTTSIVSHLIECKELGISQEFSDFDTAHTFATQLAQDYPTAHIERAKFTQYFDSWGDEAGGKA